MEINHYKINNSTKEKTLITKRKFLLMLIPLYYGLDHIKVYKENIINKNQSIKTGSFTLLCEKENLGFLTYC
jgi:hypothetical protein